MSSTAAQAKSFDELSLGEPTTAVESYMEAFLQRRPLPENLREAARYALLGGGKRLRPILVIFSCEAVGGTLKQALPPAAAIEMIHAFSLVHDDLPAMDNDDLRRGRPTLHRHTSETMAILAGDALMGLAFELIANDISPPALAADVLRELAQGNNDMIAGQVYDTLPEFGPEVDAMSRLRTVHSNKTGALIRCACRMGAMMGGADKQQLQTLTQFGETIGLMFQVVDDLLDVTATTQELGKTSGKDVDQDKLTYPSVMGLEKTRAQVTQLHEQAQQMLASLGDSPGVQKLSSLCQFMSVRKK